MAGSLQPSYPANLNGRTWNKKTIQYSLKDSSLPLKSELESFVNSEFNALKLETKLTRDDNCSNCMAFKFYNDDRLFGAQPQVVSNNRISHCQINVSNYYQEIIENPTQAYLNFSIHEMTHCLGFDHTDQLVDAKIKNFPPGEQPLMASTGRFITPGYSLDDINGLQEMDGIRVKNRSKITILYNGEYQNAFLVNKKNLKRSLSKFAGEEETVFYNVFDGDYNICLRTDKSEPCLWVCRGGKNYRLESKPCLIQLMNNQKINIK